MFASALQKRKAVVLSQSQTQQQQQQTRPQLQQQQQLLAQPRAAAPVTHTPVSTTRSAASPHAAAVGRTTAATSTANASQQRSVSSASTGTSLSAMLSKRQKTEAPLAHNAASQSAAMSSFTTARPMTEAERLQPTAITAASAATKAKAKAKARVLPTKSRTATRKTQQSSSSEQTVDGVVIELSPKRRVTVRLWRAAVLIDIREYYDDNGVAKPGKKGISLSQDQWQSLLRLAPAIDEAIVLVDDDSVDAHSLEDVPERLAAASTERTITFTLSSKRRISVRSFRSAVLIDLREFYDDDNGVSRPGKKGIALSKDQWRALCAAQQQVTDAASQL